MKWEVVIKAEFILRVETLDEEGAKDLAQDSLSHVYVLDGWQDCVVLHDEWWTVDSAESLAEQPVDVAILEGER